MVRPEHLEEGDLAGQSLDRLESGLQESEHLDGRGPHTLSVEGSWPGTRAGDLMGSGLTQPVRMQAGHLFSMTMCPPPSLGDSCESCLFLDLHDQNLGCSGLDGSEPLEHSAR